MVQSKIQQAVGRGAPYVEVLPIPLSVNRAPTTSDIMPLGALFIDTSTTPDTVWTSLGNGDFSSGGNEMATTTTAGIVTITDNNDPVATKFYVDAIAIAGSPVSTTTTAGIGQLATDPEAVAGTPSTGALALFVTPSNLAAVFAAPPAQGGTTPAAGAFTNISATGVGTGNILTSDTASNFSTTGAGIDVTIDSAAGRVIINGEEAAANAITLLSAAGGIDVDAALQINIATSQSAVDAIRIVASAGGIDIDAVGAAGEDINITNTGASVVIVATESAADAIVLNATLGGIDILASGASAGEDIDIIATGSSVNISSTENAALAITLNTNGGASETIRVRNQQGTGAASIDLDSTVGGITLTSGLASADAINFVATNGGVDLDGALQVNIASSQNAIDAIRIVASAGGIDIDAVGAATEDINITNTGGSIVLSATESATDAIVIESTAGGIQILASGAAATEDIVLTATGSSIRLSATESATDAINIEATLGGVNILASGAAAGEDINVTATGSSVNIQATESDVNAITINASGIAGGINVDSGTSGVIVDTTGAISLDAAAASNLTVTGAFALDVITTLGKLSLQSGQSAVDSIEIKSLIGGIDILAAGAAAGEDIDIIATGSSVNISATESAADSITIVSTAGGIDILASGAAAGEDIDIIATGSSVNISATESAADSITIISTAGGIDISASGAAAGEDIDITATGSSVNITATENVSDAIVINASGAASGMTIDCGTSCLTIGTGIKHAVTAVATAATPYAVLGTDYVISTDTTAGVLTLTLPAAPGTGRTLVIFDGVGQAAIGGAITIDGNGNNIAAGGTSAATKAINTAFESYNLYFNGTIWLGQNVV